MEAVPSCASDGTGASRQWFMLPMARCSIVHGKLQLSGICRSHCAMIGLLMGPFFFCGFMREGRHVLCAHCCSMCWLSESPVRRGACGPQALPCGILGLGSRGRWRVRRACIAFTCSIDRSTAAQQPAFVLGSSACGPQALRHAAPLRQAKLGFGVQFSVGRRCGCSVHAR